MRSGLSRQKAAIPHMLRERRADAHARRLGDLVDVIRLVAVLRESLLGHGGQALLLGRRQPVEHGRRVVLSHGGEGIPQGAKR